MTTTTYSVSGMTCGHCVNAVTEEVSALPGLTDVKVTLDEGGRMTITSEDKPELATVAAAVAEAGNYTVEEL